VIVDAGARKDAAGQLVEGVACARRIEIVVEIKP